MMSLLKTYEESQFHELTNEEFRALSLSDCKGGEQGIAVNDDVMDEKELSLLYNTEDTINYYLKQARIICVKDGEMNLLSTKSLREMVFAEKQNAVYEKRYKFDDISQISGGTCIQPQDLQKNLHDIKLTGNLTGMVVCCNCGIPNCSAQYAWIEDRCCYVLIDCIGSNVMKIDFFPFRIDTDEDI